jgi:hypothetical protein
MQVSRHRKIVEDHMAKVIALSLHIGLLMIYGVAPSQTYSQNYPKSESLLELVFDQTTPDDAIKILGQPITDKIDQLDVSAMGKWLTLPI